MSERLAANDAQLLADIRQAEGLRLKAYPDPESPLAKTGKGSGAPFTCGYGHTGPDVGPTTTCTAAQAETWLACDVADAISCMDAAEPWWRDMTVNRQRVLTEIAFNIGLGGLQGFHRFLADLIAGRWSDAAAEMLDSLWATQTGQRAIRLSRAMAKG